jgi:hypothetical protein
LSVFWKSAFGSPGEETSSAPVEVSPTTAPVPATHAAEVLLGIAVLGLLTSAIFPTAEVRRLTLVTRNDSQFEPTMRSILNPWTELVD